MDEIRGAIVLIREGWVYRPRVREERLGGVPEHAPPVALKHLRPVSSPGCTYGPPVPARELAEVARVHLFIVPPGRVRGAAGRRRWRSGGSPCRA